MKINDLFHGFRVKSVTHIDEIKADLWRMEYEKNGADLIWLDREDRNANMTFAIAFKTIPDDDTGVFHIIEHSVLCGSEKYPVKEPFVNLMKTSVNTFLNAMTGGDITYYPVSSRNQKDLLNMMDVYLDAVFHPLSVKNPLAFLQEGWHYEFDENGTPSYNGVVYSEMKGSYAAPGRKLYKALMKGLFPDNCYSKESGGDPEHITELSWQKYCECHRKYYSASNSRIFLDGKMDLEAVFSKLDEYLSEFDRIDVDASIPMQKPVSRACIRDFFAIGEDENTDMKTLYSEGRIFADFTEHERIDAAAILFEILTGTRESPVRKAVVDAGLCEKISIGIGASNQQMAEVLTITNTDEDKIEKILEIVDKTIKEIIEKGVDKEELEASLNEREFSMREEEDGLKGLSNLDNMLSSWLYDGDPASEFDHNEVFAALREKINDGSGYYENLLREIFIDNKNIASAVLIPSKTYAAEQAEHEAEKCAAEVAAMTPAERRKAEDDLAELRRFQETEDSDEDIAKIPVLTIKDLTDELPPVVAKPTEYLGVPSLFNPQDTNGIIYARAYFDLKDFTVEELFLARMLKLMYADFGTSGHSTSEVLKIEKRDFGDFRASVSVKTPPLGKEGYLTDFFISLSMLETNAYKVLDFIREVIFESDYNDEKNIINHLENDIYYYENQVKTRPTIAIRRAGARKKEAQYVCDVTGGAGALEGMKKLKQYIKENGISELVADLNALTKKIFVRSRMRFCITGTADREWIEKFVGLFPEGSPAAQANVRGVLPDANEGIEIPAKIGFAAMCGTYGPEFKHTGADFVAESIINLNYLWNEVRVKGGAYGVSLSIKDDGLVFFSSYRDPQPANSIEVYKKAGQALREVTDEELENYVISSYGSYRGLSTPLNITLEAEELWLHGLPFDLYETRRREILATNREKLCEIADMLDKAVVNASRCVIGGKSLLSACYDSGAVDTELKVLTSAK